MEKVKQLGLDIIAAIGLLLLFSCGGYIGAPHGIVFAVLQAAAGFCLLAIGGTK